MIQETEELTGLFRVKGHIETILVTVVHVDIRVIEMIITEIQGTEIILEAVIIIVGEANHVAEANHRAGIILIIGIMNRDYVGGI